MAWSFEGTYFENCNCDTICPCTWSGLTEAATHDRCKVLLNYHIITGHIDGVDVRGLTFGIVADTPPVMSEGNWRVGVLLDASATPEQAAKLGEVISGQKGGPLAVLSPLIGEMLGIESAPVTFEEDGKRHSIRWGEMAEIVIEDFHAGANAEPVQLTNVAHPSNSTLTVGKAVAARVSAFGIEFGQAGSSSASSPFSWSGE